MGKKNGKRKRPGFIRPMLCKSVQELPRGYEWIYEVKRGGQRSIAVKDGRQVRLFAENGRRLDFPDIEQAVREMNPARAIVDGEIIALNGESEQSDSRQADCESQFQLYAWDLLHLEGYDLIDQPLERRKAQLNAATFDSGLLFSPSLNCEPDELIAEVSSLSLEGVLAKRKDSIYEPGQCTGAWVKVCVRKRHRSPRASARQVRRFVGAMIE